MLKCFSLAVTACDPCLAASLQELQDIIRGRQGSTSLLDSFKPSKVQETVQKNVVTPLQKTVVTPLQKTVVAPLQAEIKKAAPAPAKPASGAHSCPLLVTTLFCWFCLLPRLKGCAAQEGQAWR